MKKKILFYLIWDVLLFLSMYLYYVFTILRNAHYAPTVFNNLWPNWAASFIVGLVFALLIFVSAKFKMTKKTAITELVLVGLFAFYIAGGLALPYMIEALAKLSTLSPAWLMSKFVPASIIGSILMGYEIFIFILRMSKIKRKVL